MADEFNEWPGQRAEVDRDPASGAEAYNLSDSSDAVPSQHSGHSSQHGQLAHSSQHGHSSHLGRTTEIGPSDSPSQSDQADQLSQSSPPGPADSDYFSRDPRQVALERVEAGIGSGILAVVLVLGAVFAGAAARFGLGWWLGVGIACVVWFLLSLWMFVWPPIHHRYVRWRLDDTGLEIHRGVFWRHILSVPLARLQHADLAQGPLQRQWGLAKLIVYTAGTQHASVELEGLAYETAVGLRDHLLRQLGTRDVV